MPLNRILEGGPIPPGVREPKPMKQIQKEIPVNTVEGLGNVKLDEESWRIVGV
jgi:hypothetical protein